MRQDQPKERDEILSPLLERLGARAVPIRLRFGVTDRRIHAHRPASLKIRLHAPAHALLLRLRRRFVPRRDRAAFGRIMIIVHTFSIVYSVPIISTYLVILAKTMEEKQPRLEEVFLVQQLDIKENVSKILALSLAYDSSLVFIREK